MRSYLAAGALALGVAGLAQAQTPPPASAFGRLPAIQDVAISPNGQTIAILGGSAQVRSLSFATIDQPGLRALDLGKVEAVSVSWVGDDYALARVAYWKSFGPRLAYRFERNISVNTQGQAVARMLDGDGDSQLLVDQPVLGVTAGPPPRAIVFGLQVSNDLEGGIDTRIKRKGQDDPYIATLWSVDPATGKGRILEKGGHDTEGWDVDLSGEARVRYDIDDLNHQFSLYVRAKGVRQWTPIIQHADEEALYNYLGYSTPEDAIYLLETKDGVAQVKRRRLVDGVVEPVGQLVRGADVSMIWDKWRNAAAGVHVQGEPDKVEWLDAELGGVHAALSKVFKGKTVCLCDWSSDRTRFLVRIDDEAPGEWYLFDRTRKELSPLGEAYPELKGVALGATRLIRYKARDGLEIPAYLTLPPGAKATGAKPPLIVLPHGGPAARDHAGFDWLTQFLATRGYAVLRPQFRGSAGFGDGFERAGRGEWGGKIQTDLLDGVAAVAASGEIDPDHVCIVGASFGGYSALAGATLHPEAYRCAASIAGISDLGLLSNEQVRAYGADTFSLRSLRRMLAEASTDKLRATSPLRQVAQARAPILLIHADHDTVVPPEQSEIMAAALKAAGKPVEYVTLVGDDHYLMQSATRTQMLETLGAFLAKNLPVTP